MTILIARVALVTCPAIFLHAVHQPTRMLEVGRACATGVTAFVEPASERLPRLSEEVGPVGD